MEHIGPYAEKSVLHYLKEHFKEKQLFHYDQFSELMYFISYPFSLPKGRFTYIPFFGVQPII